MIAQSELTKQISLPFNSIGDSLTFPRLVEDIALNTRGQLRKDFKEYLENMDYMFRYSKDRTSRYYVANTSNRTIITMLGEITYKRTLYRDKTDKSYYCYVDEKLGIGKYYRYTNDVAALACECYANENSMIKVGEEIGDRIHSSFSLKDTRDYALPRQTIYNLLKRSKEIRIKPSKEKKKVSDLYVLMDEKYIGNNLMLKSSLMVEGLNTLNKKRHSYINQSYYSSYKENFSDNLINHINDRYDLNYLKAIHILADGGTWIKNASKELKFPNISNTKYLCKFHFHQALWRMAKEKEIYNKLIDYLYHDDKNNLYELMNSILDDKNLNDIKYIKNNYQEIQNTIHLKGMNCAMEQVISHHIASQFSNVPKVYSPSNINRYLSYRDNYRNGENMKILFLKSLDDKTIDDIALINKETLNFSMFDFRPNEHSYTTKLNTGKNKAKFYKNQ
jgi:hypothetical protein